MRPKSPEEIAIMRQGGRELARILQLLATKVVPGATGKDIAAVAAKEIEAAGLQPVLLGYQGFPDVMCISLNSGVVHGIPSKEPFKDGDLVKLDLTVGHKSLIVDAAITVYCGANPSADVERLIAGTKSALDAGIAAIKGGGTRTGDIASVIQKVLDQNKLGIVRDLVGHGVGYGVHEEPNVPNYGFAGSGPKLPEGITIAIEPMATLGDWRVDILPDDWTVVSRDGSLAAHFEHTVAITANGAEILTQL